MNKIKPQLKVKKLRAGALSPYNKFTVLGLSVAILVPCKKAAEIIGVVHK